jgi:hypothetical protein
MFFMRRRQACDCQTETREKKLTPIQPELGLYLQPHIGKSKFPVDIDRFVHLFLEAWQRIPAVDRQSLLDYWRGLEKSFEGKGIDPRGYCPLIALDDSLMKQRSAAGACMDEGRSLFFWSGLPLCHGEKAAEWIANVLAQVLRYATGCAQSAWDSVYLPALEQSFRAFERGEIDREAFQRQCEGAAALRSEIENRAVLLTLQSWGFKAAPTKLGARSSQRSRCCR